MHAEDPVDTVQRARGDHVQRAAGHDLLGGLEDQPHPAGQLGRAGQRTGRAEQDRGMCVVAAHVRGTVHGGRVRQAGRLGQRQRVHVGTKRDTTVTAADVADDAGAAGQHPRLQADRAQQRNDQLGSGELLAGKLGMGVDVPPPGQHVGRVGA